jgi:hypothetical protein
MSPLFYGVVVLGCAGTIYFAWLLVSSAIEKYAAWREARDIRIKNETLNRYNMAAFRGSKPRQL